MMTRNISRYFELNWLARHDKGIVMPELVIENQIYVAGSMVGGFYQRAFDGEMCINGKYYDGDKGLIAITGRHGNDSIVNAISHEWRHHLQYINGIKSITVGWATTSCDNTYKNSIINYFTSSITEMDALIYSLHKGPDNTSMEWYQWLVKCGAIKHIKGLG